MTAAVNDNARPYLATIFLTSFTGVMVQICALRELVVIFYGNELSTGAILFVWLLFTAAGSITVARLKGIRKPASPRVALWQTLLALSLPYAHLAISSSRRLLGSVAGEMIGFIPLLLITLTALAPVCLISGALYTLVCRAAYQSGEREGTVSRVYFAETLGSALGGLLLSLVFIYLLSIPDIIILLGIVNLISALWLRGFFFSEERKKSRLRLLLTGLTALMLYITARPALTSVSNRLLWGHDGSFITSRDTPHGNITLLRWGEQISFFTNGLRILTVPDPQQAEESVHLSLLEHPEPRLVLLLGGALGGSIREALRHPSVTRLDYVELDPRLVSLSRTFLPRDETSIYDDPRVTFHFQDGRRFIKQERVKYDVIICNLPNPYTAQLNRFYTVEFFREVKRRLAPGGIFTLKLRASENTISPEMADFIRIILATVNRVFPASVVLPGETIRMIASIDGTGITDDPDVLLKRLRERNLDTRYVSGSYLPFQLSRERRDYLAEKLAKPLPAQVNRDFTPVGYYFDTVLWSTRYAAWFKNIFIFSARLRFEYLAGAALLFFLILRLWIGGNAPTGSRRANAAVYISILSVGFTEISLEIVLVLAFQIIFGYAYAQLSLIIAGYMTGLALGSGRMMRNLNRPGKMEHSVRSFAGFQAGMALFPLALLLLLKVLQNAPALPFSPLSESFLFLMLAAAAGYLGGSQFPLANYLLTPPGKPPGRIAGTLYGIDLSGSSLGALFTSAFLIPLLGISSLLYFLALVNFLALYVVLLLRKR